MRAVFFLLLLSTPAFACPDLGGKYVNQAGEYDVDLLFEQRSCASASTSVYEGEYGGTVERFFDGRLRVTFEQDGTVFRESEVWDGARMLTLEDYYWKASNARMQVRGVWWLDENRDLRVEKVAIENGKETGRYFFFYKRR